MIFNSRYLTFHCQYRLFLTMLCDFSWSLIMRCCISDPDLGLLADHDSSHTSKFKFNPGLATDLVPADHLC